VWRLLDVVHLVDAMTYQLRPAEPATEADLRAAQERARLLAAELPRVRDAATAWRNSLGGLLVALVGFSLIKGRSDVSQLAQSWAAAVGILLLAALIAGAAGAILLIRAANGRPSVMPIHEALSRNAADHVEAVAAANALRRGIALTLCCAALLVAAVGTTWYGPGRDQPVSRISTRSETAYGSLMRADQGHVALRAQAREGAHSP
jgi:hypothetical protein